ncbi:MAG: ABC transporter ATP-binding protein [Candidatus Aenigmatarchaeota archaeon]
MNTKIKIEHLYKKFGNKEVLKDINLEIKEGEIFGIFGPSGCGKTTLLRIIAGLEKPDSGKIYIDGKEIVSDKTFVSPEKRSISFIFQHLGLWPHMSVEEHLEFVLSNYNYEKNEIKKIIEKTLKLVNLNGYEKRKPESLSGGEKQRLAIARAVVKKADILLLDEPLTALDIYRKEEIKNLLLSLRKETKITIIYVTHDIIDIVNLCDRIALISNGSVEKVKNTSAFLKEIKKQIKIL